MPVKPFDYQPPFNAEEFIAKPSSDPDEAIEVGVLFVGGGPAGLAGAIHLAQLLENEPELMESLGEMPIVVVEKGKYPGAHLMSGAVVNPSPFRKLFPDLKDEDFPFYQPVTSEALYFLTEKKAFKAPFMPPTMQNHGNFVASVSRIGQWLAEKAEEMGIMVLNETAAVKVLVDEGAVKGIHTDDKGLDRDGNPGSNYEPGVDMVAQATVIAEGTLGHLSQTILQHFNIRRPNPQIYALGVKEIWEVKKPLDRIIHTMGWPLRTAKKYREFGGSFIYPMGKDKVTIGLVVGMDYADASLSVHDLLQQLKLHPLVKEILEGGKRLDKGWGAKTIPEGGYHSLPETLHVPGAILTGDAAGFVNVPALKGVHYAMWSGIYAAQAIFEALKAGKNLQERGALEAYDQKVRNSFLWQELYRVRNMRPAFQHGFWKGSFLAGLMSLTGGKFPGGEMRFAADSEHPIFEEKRQYPKPDNEYIFDKLSSVYASGNRSRDTMPNHLKLKREVPEELGNLWINMCPAGVYEWETTEDGKRVIRVNAPNCVHCGAITAKGGRFTPPEGGAGPEYSET